MITFNEIIKKLLLYDELNYLQLPKEINEKIIINFKESKSNNKENKNIKIHIKELSEYFKLDKLKIVKLLYFNIEKFHQILYDYDTEIILENEEKNLSYIFYVTLLIKYNPSIINYSFTIELIRGINNKINEKNNKIYQKLLLSKAIFDLIDTYKGLDEYNNKVNEIQNIETNNKNIFENLKNENNKNNENNNLKLNFDLTYIKSKTVEQIYIDIIIYLLTNKSEDYNYIYGAIKEMDLELINITKTMLEEIKIFLDDEKNEMMNKYLISKSNDLLDENKINFSYILIKYILKSSTFIYQIKFFQEIRKNLFKLCKPNNNIFFKQQKIDKLKYISEVMFNYEYYNNIYKIKDKNLNEEKLTQIDDSDSNIKNNKTVQKYANPDIVNDTTTNNNSTLMASTNKSTQNIKINSNENNQKSTKKESVKKGLNERNRNSQNINENKKEINNNKKSQINKYTNNDFNLNGNASALKNITNNNGSSQKSKGTIISTFKNSIKKISDHIISSKDKNDIKKKYTAEFITEIQNIFVSGGTNNELITYNDSYGKIFSNQTDDWVYNAILSDNKVNKSLIFLASTKKKIYTFSESTKISENENLIENNLLYLLFMEGSYYFACCENGVFLYSSLTDKLQNKNKFTIFPNILMKSAIKINVDLLVFKSNKIASKGISKLLLFNFRNKKDIPNFLESDEEYSFVFSPLGQALITHIFNDTKQDIENKILLYACKKYIKNQENGILLLYNFHQEPGDKDKDNQLEKIKVDSYFHNTGIFEPYCICPLIVVDLKNILDATVEIKETDYFLVGGFEKRRKQGMIKLYKIIYDEKNTKVTSIEYIQDFNSFDNDFQGFKGPVSCITQSKKDGNLLITCWDGNIYLVDRPNIQIYYKQDEQIKNSAINFFPPPKNDKNQNQFNNNNEIENDEKTTFKYI